MGGGTFGLTLVLAICLLFSGAPVLASAANRQPPAPVVAATRQAAGQRAGIPAERLQVRSATPRTWPDGCLGLPRPDELCTQALVEGWEIVLTDNGKTWTYRTDNTGRNTRLDPKK
ncbi:hypothetical protein V0288_18575 [Pannus brasiliensis CCIBt3594]|uniref:Uncharacterized protein n=1 Tax=Pannus brasiliensis CCIBt3594 TaxID=1427578 RepID=A0AAW9QPZ3_9CHRO